MHIIYIKYGLFEIYLILKITYKSTDKRYHIMRLLAKKGYNIPSTSFYRIIKRLEKEDIIKIENQIVILTDKGKRLFIDSENKIRIMLRW